MKEMTISLFFKKRKHYVLLFVIPDFGNVALK